jgi:long-chain acyl-CoA synthetase
MVGEPAISYKELETCSRLTAERLIGAGVRPGDRVAILSESMPAWGVASLGIARAGAVAVPLLVDFRASQVAEILEHAGAKVAFVSRKQSVKLKDSSVTVVAIEELGACRTYERTQEFL